MSLTLNWLEETERWNTGNVLETNDYIMTNISGDGTIIPLRNDMKIARTVSLDSQLELLRIYLLGYWENVESHLYRFYPEAEPELGTVEWSSMDNNQYNVFVPDYPVLMTDTWKRYQKGLSPVQLVAQNPEAWQNSYSAVFSALSNRLTFMDPGEEAKALVKERFAAMQQYFEARFNELTARLKAEKDLTVRQEIATGASSQMAEEAQNLALALYRHIVYGEALPGF